MIDEAIEKLSVLLQGEIPDKLDLSNIGEKNEKPLASKLNQRVDFMGDFSEAFNAMIVSLDNKEKMLQNKIDELEQALARIKRLEGILPICSHCKKIRLKGADPKNKEGWLPVEQYISEKTEALFSHSICPDCMKTVYSEME